MIGIGKYISSTISNAMRTIKLTIWGRTDTRERIESMPFGFDAQALANMQAITMDTSMDGKSVVIGFVNTKQLAAAGESRMYALDSDGNLLGFFYCKSDGTMLIGGDDNFAVKFNELKTEYNSLKSTVNDLASKWSAFATAYVPGSPSATGLPVTLAGQNVPANSSDIDNAKNTKIKTIS
jgi:hypothetical protein